MKTALLFSALLQFACAAAVQATERLPRFTVGKAQVTLNASGRNVAPVVKTAKYAFVVGADVSCDFEENRLPVRAWSLPTLEWKTRRLPNGMQVEYERVLVTGPETNRITVGKCRTVIDFTDGAVRVRSVVWPQDPGRFRMRAGQPFRQSVSILVADWVGSEINTTDAAGNMRRTRFPSAKEYDRKSWNLNTGRYGSKITEIGTVGAVLRFVAGKSADFRVNRFRDGLGHEGCYVNADTMYVPPWDGPLEWEFAIEYR